MAEQAVVELVVDGRGALQILDQFKGKMEGAGQASERSTGAVDRYNAAMAKFADAQARGLAITTQSIERRSAEQRALERWQSQVDRTMRLEIQLRREAERAAVDMSNAVALGYTTQEQALRTLTALERQHAVQLQAVTGQQQNATRAITGTAAANNTLAGSMNLLAAANDNALGSTANIAAQFQDVAVTAAMGMNPLMIALQQGTQLSSVLNTMQSPLRGLAAALGSVLNPVSLLTIGFVALAAAAVQFFTSAEDEAEGSATALERHREWLDSILKGYDEVAKAAKAAGDAARSMPQGVIEIELTQGLRRHAEEAAQLDAAIAGARDRARELQGAFGLDRADMQDVAAQVDALQQLTFSSSSTRAELEAVAVAARNLADSALNVEIQNSAQSFYDLTMRLIELSGRTRETETALDSLTGASARWGGSTLPGVSDAIERVARQMVDLRSEKQKLDDAFRSDAMGARTLSEIYALADAYKALNESIAARDAQKNAEGLAAALADLDRRAREVTINGLDDRKAATLRIVDQYKAAEAELRSLGASEIDIARNTAVMNEAIRQSVEHFDELERKAGEKGAAKAIKEVDRAMESFISRADGLLATAFPGEAARREAEELLRLLDLYGNKLDAMQRAAVEMRIQDQFQAASLGVRELDRTTQTSGDNIKSLLGDIGNIAAGIFDGAKDSVWDWVDAIVAAIGQIGQRLMAFGSEVKQADPIAGLAASAASAARGVPANYVGPNYTGTAPAIGARAASGVGEIAASAISASANLIRYTNQGATRNLQLSQRLNDAMTPVLQKLGLTMEVFSGGQPGIGSGGARVGSVRHDHGNAADVFFNQNGMRLNWANPAHRPIFEQIISMSRGQGVTGFGVGPGYMQPGSMHIGFGSPAVWGAGGKGANAQGWAVDAFNNPISLGKTGSVAANQNIAPVVSPVAAPASSGLAATGGSSGTFQKFAAGAGALASGFASGYQTQDPIMGALSGGLGALGTGDPMAIGLGLLGGLIGGIVGLAKATDEARRELAKLAPELDTFFKVGGGFGVSSMAESLRQYSDQAKEYAKVADKARASEWLDKLRESVVLFEETLKKDFRTTFDATIASLSSGQGLDGELAQATQGVLSLREELKAFIADAEFVYGVGSAKAMQAQAAAQQQLLAAIEGGAGPTSEMAAEIARLGALVSPVRVSLEQVGMAASDADKAIRERLVGAIEALRKSFEDDLSASLNELTGRGYLNQIADAQKKYNERLSDAAALGLDGSGAMEELSLTLFNVMKSAGATTDELEAFGSSVDGAGAALRDFLRQAVDSATATLRQTLDVWRDFVDGIAEYRLSSQLNPTVSALSPQARLETARAEYERVRDLAAGGDRDAMGKIANAVANYREQAASFYSSTKQYADIFFETDATLTMLETQAASQISIAEQTLSYAEQNVAGLSAANDNLMTLVQSSEALRAAVDAYLGVGGTMEASIANMAAAAIATAQSSSVLVAQSVQTVADAVRGSTDNWIAMRKAERGDITRDPANVQLGVEDKTWLQKSADWFVDNVIDPIGNLFGWANGGAFINGMPVTAFATGGVVSNPTLFPMRNGMGLMGEAGPEAIMPLRRGSDGRLGVSAAAGNDNRELVAELRGIATTVARAANEQIAALKRENAELRGKIDQLTDATTRAGTRRNRNRTLRVA